MEGFLDELLKVLGAAIATAIVALIVRLFKRIGLSIDAEKQAKLEKFAADGIKRAEEWAADRIKRGLAPPSGSDKLTVAINNVSAELPNVSETTIQHVIHAKLADVGAGATVPKA